MIKDIDKEIRALESNDNVKGKLLFISLYNELYNKVFCNMPVIQFDCFEPDFNYAFDNLNLVLEIRKDKKYGAKSLITAFITSLRGTDIRFNNIAMKDIKEFKSNLITLCDSKKHIDVLDKNQFYSFKTKVDLALCYDDFMRKISSDAKELYGEEKSKELLDELNEVLTKKLAVFLKENIWEKEEKLEGNLQLYLRENAKNFLVYKSKNKDFDFLDFAEYIKVMKKLNKSEKEMMKMAVVYYLSGYAANGYLYGNGVGNQISRDAGISSFRGNLIRYEIAAKCIIEKGKVIIKERKEQKQREKRLKEE